MIGLIRLALLLVICLHGYFYIRYDTVHPCRAAMVRSVEDQDPLFTSSARAILGDEKAEQALGVVADALAKERGYSMCYRIAILGTRKQSVF